MPTFQTRAELEQWYENAAQDYLRSLPPEHFMEATGQATQRKITLESLDLVHAARPDVQVFNELLIQYPHPNPKRTRPKQVVPDNMVVLWNHPIDANGSYSLSLQPTGPFLVMEYVSKHNKRKDYEDNMEKYEEELKVPYYLLFYPDTQDLTLYHHTGTRYVSVPPNEQERHPIPELEMEVGLLDGWVRYWFRGKLLPLPADLQRSLDEALKRADEASKLAEKATKRAVAAEQEVARLQTELEMLRKQKDPPSE